MFHCFYNSIMWSMLISVLLFQNTWLEMRVNLGFVFFVLIGILFLIQMLNKTLKRFCATFIFSTLSLIISSAVLYFVLGSERLKIIPASIVREGIMQNRIQFSTINIFLVSVAIIGWILTFLIHEH